MSVGEYFPKDYQRKATIKTALVASDASGGIVSLANPYGVEVFITRCIVDATTAATGVCTINVGVDADGATGDDTLLDGLDVGTAAITTDNLTTPGTNGLPVVRWGATEYLVAEMATGAAAGIVGSVYVEIQRI